MSGSWKKSTRGRNQPCSILINRPSTLHSTQLSSSPLPRSIQHLTFQFPNYSRLFTRLFIPILHSLPYPLSIIHFPLSFSTFHFSLFTFHLPLPFIHPLLPNATFQFPVLSLRINCECETRDSGALTFESHNVSNSPHRFSDSATG